MSTQRITVALMPAKEPSLLRGLARTLWREWIGDGPILGRGNFAEFLWANIANLEIGLWILAHPVEASHSHGLALMLWRWPPWAVGLTFVVSAVLTDAGLLMSFFRGRCVASRLARISGAAIGFWIWICILGSIYLEAQVNIVALVVGQLGVIAYLRSVCLAWRRFPRSQ